MAFIRKHPMEVATLLLAAIVLALYLFLVRPVMMKRQKVMQATEEKIAQLRRYRNEPPSQKVIGELSREKKRLGEQYEEVIKTLHFARPVPVQKVMGPLSLYFEQQLEETGNELAGLAGLTVIKIPDRLGFGKETPRSKEELSLLLSQLDAARELVSLVIKSGVSSLSAFNPLPSESKSIEVSGKPLLKELEFELEVRAKISVLTELLYKLQNHSFTVKNLDIQPVSGGQREVPSINQGQVRRRRRRVLSGDQLGKQLEKKEKTASPVELKAKLLITTQLLLSN